MYDFEDRSEANGAMGVRRLRARPGFLESYWALALIAGFAGGLNSLIVGGAIRAVDPDFPTMLVTIPIAVVLGITIGHFWGRNRKAKALLRAKIEES